MKSEFSTESEWNLYKRVYSNIIGTAKLKLWKLIVDSCNSFPITRCPIDSILLGEKSHTCIINVFFQPKPNEKFTIAQETHCARSPRAHTISIKLYLPGQKERRLARYVINNLAYVSATICRRRAGFIRHRYLNQRLVYSSY